VSQNRNIVISTEMIMSMPYQEVPTFLIAGHETTRSLRFAVQLEHFTHFWYLALLLFGPSTPLGVTQQPALN
jgi:hypothetical protein